MDAKAFSTFSAVALAGSGRPTRDRHAASRRPPDAQTGAGRAHRAFPSPPAHTLLVDLRQRISAWVAWHFDSISNHWPEMPEGVTDRPADVWEPLLAIADEAGGHWPQTARQACVDLLRSAQTVDSGSLGVRLLSDLRRVWETSGDPDGMHTATMIEKLIRSTRHRGPTCEASHWTAVVCRGASGSTASHLSPSGSETSHGRATAARSCGTHGRAISRPIPTKGHKGHKGHRTLRIV